MTSHGDARLTSVGTTTTASGRTFAAATEQLAAGSFHSRSSDRRTSPHHRESRTVTTDQRRPRADGEPRAASRFVRDARVLDHGEGVLLVLPAGIAGQVSGHVDFSSLVPGVTLLGTFGLAINRTNARVTESVTVGARTLSLDLPAGPFVRIFGTGVQLVVAGQTLSGDFAIEQSGTPATTKIVATNVTLRIGTGTTDLITITNGSASFLVALKRDRRQAQRHRHAEHPGHHVRRDAHARAEHVARGRHRPRRRPAHAGIPKQTFKIGAKNLTLNVAGQQLSGDFFFSQSGAVRRRVIRLSAEHVTSSSARRPPGSRSRTATASSSSRTRVSPDELSADITPVLPPSLAGVISIPSSSASRSQINNTARAGRRHDAEPAPAGPVRARRGHDPVDADAADHLRPDGQRDVRLRAGPERRSGRRLNTSDDTKILKIAVSNLDLSSGPTTPASTSRTAARCCS